MKIFLNGNYKEDHKPKANVVIHARMFTMKLEEVLP